MPKIVKKNFDINHDDVYSTIEYANDISGELSDEELEKIERFKNLEIYQQDILMLRSQGYSLREIGSQLGVSYNWVNQRLKEIRNILDD